MSKITYCLAVIGGRVCYECIPSAKGAFYHKGTWYKPFTTVEEMRRKSKTN